MFHQMCKSVRSVFGLVASLQNVFATQPRIHLSVQLLVNKELFHQSSFYLITILTSVHLPFKHHFSHESRGECRGMSRGNVLDPDCAVSWVLPKKIKEKSGYAGLCYFQTSWYFLFFLQSVAKQYTFEEI